MEQSDFGGTLTALRTHGGAVLLLGVLGGHYVPFSEAI